MRRRILWRIYLGPWMVLGLFFSESGQARFLMEDADQVDDEGPMSREFYSDRISYRFPVAWDRLWSRALVGYRVSAGSLDIRRFDFIEDVKLHVDPEEEWSFSYVQRRREDVIDQRTERQVQVTWKPFWDVTYGLMADGGVFKEHGDLGLALGYRPGPWRHVEVFVWSVDHYYDTKKVDPDDVRPRSLYSSGIRGDWLWGETVHADFRYEYDQPFQWTRASKAYVYDYHRRFAEAELTWYLDDGFWIAGRISHEYKREGKSWPSEWNPGGGGDQSVAYQRLVQSLELAGGRDHGRWDMVGGAIFYSRDVDYNLEGASSGKELPDQGDYSTAKRREGALYGTAMAVIGESRNMFVQYGLIGNRLVRKERRREWCTEVKAQLAYAYHFNPKAQVFINTTWDLDQLQRDFPYRDEGFRPWGGGNVQFVAVF